MMKVRNPGIVTHIEVDENKKFKFLFVALGVAIRPFSVMQKVIGLDGMFFKSTCKGTLLIATCQDVNFHCYSITCGVVDIERDESWNWFLAKLKDVIGEPNGLVFISDRHGSIQKVVANVFPIALYGACVWHLEINLKNKFKNKSVISIFNKAVRAYKILEFIAKFSKLERRFPHVHKFLVDVSVER